MNTLSLIIPAAGSGVRMGAELAKPFIEIGGRAILNHSIDKFINIQGLKQIIIVASARNVPLVKGLIADYDQFAGQFLVVKGGKERQDSIYNALQKVGSEAELVMVHDAVRPFVDRDHITDCIEAASEYGAAALGVPVTDTIKEVNNKNFIESTPDRSKMWKIQTPQVFERELLISAYEKAMEKGLSGTDDSSLVESYGVKVKIVEGGVDNFKITYPIDLKMAELIIGGEG